jgi:hypothetical protein
MSMGRTAFRVAEDCVLREHPFMDRRGAPCAWLDVGEDSELGIYGSPAAMRRLG